MREIVDKARVYLLKDVLKSELVTNIFEPQIDLYIKILSYYHIGKTCFQQPDFFRPVVN